MIRSGIAALLLVLLAPRVVHAHPLHTTITELTEDRAHKLVRATIRIFADDFGTAITKASGGHVPTPGAQWEAAAVRYVTGGFILSDRGGRAIPLKSCGLKKTGDLYFVCLEGESTSPLSLLLVRCTLLSEFFSDQINIVQATSAGARKSVLFTRGDRAKPIS